MQTCMYINFKYFMTMHLRITVRIKPRSACEYSVFYYILNVVNHVHISVTFCDHIQGGVLQRMYYKDMSL